jgi:hypothetical protein
MPGAAARRPARRNNTARSSASTLIEPVGEPGIGCVLVAARLTRRLSAVIFAAAAVCASMLASAGEAIATPAAPPVTWSPLTPTSSPSGRSAAAVAYDAATKTTLLLGGAIPPRRGIWRHLGLERHHLDRAVPGY